MNLGHENASNYIDGVGLHWYLDTVVPASYLVAMHNTYPSKSILKTESCLSKGIFFLTLPFIGVFFLFSKVENQHLVCGVELNDTWSNIIK